MGVSVKEDLVRGSASGYSLTDQVIVRVFQVSGLSATYNPQSIVPAAMFAVDSINPSIRIPSMTQAHPDPALSLFVVVDIRTGPDVTFDVIDVFVTYRYRLFAGGYLKTSNGTLRTIKMPAFDSSGVALKLPYNPIGSSHLTSSSFLRDRLLINGTFTFKILERLDPEYFNTNYAGAVNYMTWRGYPPRTVMLLPIVGSTQDNFWYNNQYSFHYREETHDTYVFYVDDNTGEVPVDVAQGVKVDGTNAGNGWIRLQPEWQVDIGTLLPWIPNTPPSSYGYSTSAVLYRIFAASP